MRILAKLFGITEHSDTQTIQRPSPRPADVEGAVAVATASDIEVGVVNQNV